MLHGRLPKQRSQQNEKKWRLWNGFGIPHRTLSCFGQHIVRFSPLWTIPNATSKSAHQPHFPVWDTSPDLRQPHTHTMEWKKQRTTTATMAGVAALALVLVAMIGLAPIPGTSAQLRPGLYLFLASPSSPLFDCFFGCLVLCFVHHVVCLPCVTLCDQEQTPLPSYPKWSLASTSTRTSLQTS